MVSLERISDLTCRVVRSNAVHPPELICLLCHGFGAPGDDLVPLGVECLQREAAFQGRVAFVFPEAPLSLSDQGLPGGRAWWPLNVLELQRAVQEGEFRDLREQTPPGLPEARERLLRLLAELQARWHLPSTRIVLGGFSQGAMLATDVALHLPENAGGLIIYSGTLLNEELWRRLALRHRGLKVLQSHGRMDPLLSYVAAAWLKDLLESAGVQVEFHAFNGMHTIPGVVFEATIRFLLSLLEQAESRSETDPPPG